MLGPLRLPGPYRVGKGSIMLKYSTRASASLCCALALSLGCSDESGGDEGPDSGGPPPPILGGGSVVEYAGPKQ